MSWYSELNQDGRNAFKASFLGWAVDALDYMVYTFAIATLIQLWGINRGEAGMLATATLLFSAVGGWGAGILADRYGRVRILEVTVLWYSICTVLVGFTTDFWQIFILRAVQGLGFGGEWAVGSVLMGEYIATRHRGKAVGTVQSGWAIGWGVAAVMYAVLFSLLPQQWAWRALFWLGVLPAVLALYIRLHVREPAIFVQTRKAQAASAHRVSPWAIFSPRLLRATVLTALMCTGIQGGYYAITTWLPTYLKTVRHLSVLGTSGYLAVTIIGAFCGYITGAYLTDKVGRRANIIIFAILSGASVYVYTQLPLTDGEMLAVGFPLGFAASGIFSGLGAYLTELFPSEVRATAQGFSYNFGRGVGALFPTLIGYLSIELGLGAAIGIFAGTAYAVALLCTFSLPETRGKGGLRSLTREGTTAASTSATNTA